MGFISLESNGGLFKCSLPKDWAQLGEQCGDRAPLDVPSPQGLKAVLDVHGRPRHSVRGIIVHRRNLYVADDAGDVVKISSLFETRYALAYVGAVRPYAAGNSPSSLTTWTSVSG